MNRAICYFSATGNSFDVAKKLNKTLNADLFYIPNTIIENLSFYDEIILISPIYSFGLPIPTTDFIKKLSVYKDKRFYAVLTYGGFSADALYFTKTQFTAQGLNLLAAFKIKMPESYTLFMTVPEFYIKKTLKATQSKCDSIAMAIENGIERQIKSNIFASCVNTYNTNSKKWHNLPNEFVIAESCTSCGYCQSICPTKNIVLIDGKPTFKDSCVACLACYQRCPNKAINYGNKTTSEQKRYFNPNVDFEEMK